MLNQKREELAAKQAALKSVFDEAGPDRDFANVKSLDGDTAAKVEAIGTMNNELEAVFGELKSLEAAEVAAKRAGEIGDWLDAKSGVVPPPVAGDDAQGYKSLGESFVGSQAYKAFQRGSNTGPVSDIDISHAFGNGGVSVGQGLKTLMSTTAGFAPQAIRSGRLVGPAERPVQMLDFIPSSPTDQVSYVFMEETTSTLAAAEAAEAGTYAEAAFAFTERTSPVRKIAVFLPVTDEQLEDAAGIQAYLNNRLTFALQQRLDTQVAVGNGTPPNLTGIVSTAGIQTQALGADPVPDAVYKALTKVRVTGRANPDLIAMHSNDWQQIRLLRTADGIYIWGNPSESGPSSIWGLPVAMNEALTEGTALVGDFANYCGLHIKRNISVQVSNSHSTYFVEGKQAIRADMRAAFAVYRPAAFATVTGI